MLNEPEPGNPAGTDSIRLIVQDEMRILAENILLPLLQEHGKQVAASIPKPEVITQQVLQALKAQMSSLNPPVSVSSPVGAANIAAPAVSSNGHQPNPQPSSIDTFRQSVQSLPFVPPSPDSSSTPSNTGSMKEIIQLAIAAIGGLVDKTFPMWLQYREMKLRETDLFSLGRYLAEKDPLRARWLGSILQPDPLSRYVPGIIAQNTVNTANTMGKLLLGSLVKEGWKPPEGTTIDADPLGSSLINSLISPSVSQPNATGRPSAMPMAQSLNLFHKLAHSS